MQTGWKERVTAVWFEASRSSPSRESGSVKPADPWTCCLPYPAHHQARKNVTRKTIFCQKQVLGRRRKVVCVRGELHRGLLDMAFVGGRRMLHDAEGSSRPQQRIRTVRSNLLRHDSRCILHECHHSLAWQKFPGLQKHCDGTKSLHLSVDLLLLMHPFY